MLHSQWANDKNEESWWLLLSNCYWFLNEIRKNWQIIGAGKSLVYSFSKFTLDKELLEKYPLQFMLIISKIFASVLSKGFFFQLCDCTFINWFLKIFTLNFYCSKFYSIQHIVIIKAFQIKLLYCSSKLFHSSKHVGSSHCPWFI